MKNKHSLNHSGGSMKTLFERLVVILVLVVLSESVNAQWKLLKVGGEDLNAAVQLTDDKAFVIGDNGVMLATNNRGSTWVPFHLGVRSHLNSIKFIDDYTGFVVGDRGVILKTDSRWRSWDVLSIATNYYNTDVSFINELNGVVVGYKYLYNGDMPQSYATILVTNNGGLRWVEKTIPIIGKFNSVDFYDKDHAIAVGDAGLIAYTDDGGESWYMHRITARNLNEIKVCHSGLKVIVGDEGALYVAKDRYNQWANYSINRAYNLQSICLRGSDTYVLAGEKICFQNDGPVYLSVILESKELNDNWKLVFCDMAGRFNAINFCNFKTGIAVGERGTVAVHSILYIQDPVVISDKPEKVEIQNYPNPFNPATTISYNIPELSDVDLRIYDILGNEIAVLVNEEKPAGKYEVNWNASNLPSGIYVYQLRAGSIVQMKKMMLLK
ncbi:MAG TPA: hypothetical protein DHV28_06115 [Ignavibacteriales bacterium]|nr:hypothetical protein [Ignavibacteriales bacterium]